MANTNAPLTTTALLAECSRVLETARFRQVPSEEIGSWPVSDARVYEDPYSVAALAIYETWADLEANWLGAQAALVELITQHFGKGDAKAWEGYLVLLTPSVLAHEAQLAIDEIRSNTAHVRKLVATGDELNRPGGVERALLPLLPLTSTDISTDDQTALDFLPELLRDHGVPRDAVEELVSAFLDQQPLVERLHLYLQSKEPNQ